MENTIDIHCSKEKPSLEMLTSPPPPTHIKNKYTVQLVSTHNIKAFFTSHTVY